MMADDFVVVPKPRKGIAFVEARLKSDSSHTRRGYEQLIAQLERELRCRTESKTGPSITLDSDLLDNPIIKRGVPDMFESLRVVELQGFAPSERNVPVHDVTIKINIYGFDDSPSDPSASPTSDDDTVTVLPSSHYDGLWELTLDFDALARNALAKSDHNFIVIVDDVDEAFSHGRPHESQTLLDDYVRGLDSLEAIINVLVICTSSSIETSDQQFLDKCLARRALKPPFMVERYEIFRQHFDAYMRDKVINCNFTLAGYEKAVSMP
ncbi:thyroid receptor-interacting protein 13 [Colletotrichum karsti]|uniref:Thyroid receptor-interacting protein 13 n=1 Tax=Colletotrichum karsti TaxID=1095194 RepID=A0A9P6I4S0_9PEZI|nr:thyroid receptor-interacting protein 13 [Colletotrichum karsti]KAF9873981.1 thyroid receptor-interacting protein 13 [Colletotrichum karsti]